MRRTLLSVSALAMIICLFSSCTNQPQLPQQNLKLKMTETATSHHLILLKPAIAVPATCPITSVYMGIHADISGLAGVPWLKAEPVSSGITAYLFFAGPVVNNQYYQPLHIGGKMSNTENTKILWLIDNSTATGDLTVTGKNLSTDRDTFQETFSSDGSQAPSIVNVPTSGCWRFHLQVGTDTAAAIFWVVGN